MTRLNTPVRTPDEIAAMLAAGKAEGVEAFYLDIRDSFARALVGVGVRVEQRREIVATVDDYFANHYEEDQVVNRAPKGLPRTYLGLRILRAEPGSEPGCEHLMVKTRRRWVVFWNVPDRRLGTGPASSARDSYDEASSLMDEAPRVYAEVARMVEAGL